MGPVESLPTVLRELSGGQTGVDRAALDWSIDSGLEHTGWCPSGRRAEDGVLPARYCLQETTSRRYDERTRANVVISDATLILNVGALGGGTKLTTDMCQRQGKPHLLIQLGARTVDDDVRLARNWLTANGVRALNVAGPRESKRPGIYRQAQAFLAALAGCDENQHRVRSSGLCGRS